MTETTLVGPTVVDSDVLDPRIPTTTNGVR